MNILSDRYVLIIEKMTYTDSILTKLLENGLGMVKGVPVDLD